MSSRKDQHLFRNEALIQQGLGGVTDAIREQQPLSDFQKYVGYRNVGMDHQQALEQLNTMPKPQPVDVQQAPIGAEAQSPVRLSFLDQSGQNRDVEAEPQHAAGGVAFTAPRPTQRHAKGFINTQKDLQASEKAANPIAMRDATRIKAEVSAENNQRTNTTRASEGAANRASRETIAANRIASEERRQGRALSLAEKKLMADVEMFYDGLGQKRRQWQEKSKLLRDALQNNQQDLALRLISEMGEMYGTQFGAVRQLQNNVMKGLTDPNLPDELQDAVEEAEVWKRRFENATGRKFESVFGAPMDPSSGGTTVPAGGAQNMTPARPASQQPVYLWQQPQQRESQSSGQTQSGPEMSPEEMKKRTLERLGQARSGGR